MAWAPPGGGGWPPTSDDMMRARALQRQAVQAQLTANNQPNTFQPNSPQQAMVQQLINNGWGGNQLQQSTNQNAAVSQQLRQQLLRQQHQQQLREQQQQQQMSSGYGAQNYSMLANLQNAGLQLPQGHPGSQATHAGGDGFPGSSPPLNAGHLAGGVPSTNQALLIALLQQKWPQNGPGQGAGVQVGPGRYPNQLPNSYAGNYGLSPQQIANLRSANMRSPEAFAQLQRQPGLDIPALNHLTPNAQQQIGLIQQQQQQQLQQQQQQQQQHLQHQQALMDLQLLSGQQQMYQASPNAIVDPSNGAQYRRDSSAQQQIPLGGFGQRTPITSGLGMGLANTPMGSAPLLPIFGTDLAKPSEMKASAAPLNGIATTSSGVASPVASAASVDIAASQTTADHATEQDMAESAIAATPALKTSDSAQVGATAAGSLTGSPNTEVVQAAENPQQMDMQTMLQENKDTSLGTPALGLPFPSVQLTPGGVHKERDVGTLKTLGQMLARTKSTVESAVQSGLLGGCNADDVQTVFEAFTSEKAAMLEQESALKTTPQVVEESLGGVRISEEAVKNMLSTGIMPISAPSVQIGGATVANEPLVALMPASDTQVVNETLAGDLAACQITASGPMESEDQNNRFDAFDYGFFKGESRGELLEELGDSLDNEDAEEDPGALPQEDSLGAFGSVTMHESLTCTAEEVKAVHAQTALAQEVHRTVPEGAELQNDTFDVTMGRTGY